MELNLIIWDFDDVLAYPEYDWNPPNFPITKGVREILELPNLKHCIATAGTLAQTVTKVKLCGLDDIFSPSQIFTIDMAGVGKHAPDIFLLAAKNMGEKTENTVVIDDSYRAMQGATKAGCLPICFLEREYFENEQNIAMLHKIGVKNIFYQMKDVKKFLEKLL